ncbi:ROK family protein [Pedobacter sp. MC2016-14]|uniref:ROK family protein n=1 Tax=Pedobacter sp. MC2016-14 TaxID=2897327 RepID=UPI001E550DA3|nr:ROK family protein [Pedobacter sp. MC2016-14]MCD0487583.1 ROK family protein [Pedobacter sp. MC2016-14]
MNKIVLGIDIAGSHITAALIDITIKKELDGSWVRSRVNSQGTKEEIIKSWSAVILQAAGSYWPTLDNIYIAIPGPLDYKQGISRIHRQDKYGALFGENLKELLAAELGIDKTAIHFMNDGACFLRGEVFCGSMDGYDHAIALILGTGLGTAHFENGKAEDADFWKMPFRKSIAEDYISTGWFIKHYHELTGLTIKDVKDLVENHRDNPHFKDVFDEFSMNLASFLHRFIRKKMPLAAVIGGNIVVHAEQYFLEDTKKYLAGMMGYSFPVKKSMLFEKAIIIGAASESTKIKAKKKHVAA